ncbi:MAG: hypothetical protein KDF25_13520 [Burkholderiaceae bacterium]|nr:hypothetical protein [Burkholderiaceae bacterium]
MNFTRNLMALALTGLVASTGMAMDKAEHAAANDRISADYKMAKEKCDALKDNAKDVCEKQAKGNEKVAKAELQAQYKPSDKAAYKARKERADADYEVAKEKCDDMKGNEKDVCKKDAKAAHVKAVENAKVARAQAQPADNASEKRAAIAEARKDADHEKREAEYKAAKERCEPLQGEEQNKCEADAKKKYGM